MEQIITKLSDQLQVIDSISDRLNSLQSTRPIEHSKPTVCETCYHARLIDNCPPIVSTRCKHPMTVRMIDAMRDIAADETVRRGEPSGIHKVPAVMFWNDKADRDFNRVEACSLWKSCDDA